MQYRPVEFTAAFPYSDWLYFSWHCVNTYVTSYALHSFSWSRGKEYCVAKPKYTPSAICLCGRASDVIASVSLLDGHAIFMLSFHSKGRWLDEPTKRLYKEPVEQQKVFRSCVQSYLRPRSVRDLLCCTVKSFQARICITKAHPDTVSLCARGHKLASRFRSRTSKQRNKQRNKQIENTKMYHTRDTGG